MRKQIMDLAWSLIKANKATNLSIALRLAWRRFKLTTALAAGQVRVQFVKDCGEVTTRIAELVGSGGSNPITVLFADLGNEGAIRSIRIDRLVGWSAI